MNKLYSIVLLFFVPLMGSESSQFRCRITLESEPYHMRMDKTKFWVAVHGGDAQRLKSFSHMQLNAPDKQGHYPLHITLNQGHLPAAIQLVKMGADTTKIGQNGQSAMALTREKFGRLGEFRLRATAAVWDRTRALPEAFFALPG